MGNSTYQQFLLSKEKGLVYIDGLMSFGAAGAPTLQSGSPAWYSKGVYGVSKLATGIYQIKLVENYNSFVDLQWSMQDGVTGSNVTAGSFVVGTEYQITALGNTNWAVAGVDSDYVPAVGQVFVAAAAGSGTGTAKAFAYAGIDLVNVPQSAQGLLQNQNAALGKGSSIIINMYNEGVLAAPVSGSALQFEIWLKNSSANP
jgi:hypothetical protein